METIATPISSPFFEKVNKLVGKRKTQSPKVTETQTTTSISNSSISNDPIHSDLVESLSSIEDNLATGENKPLLGHHNSGPHAEKSREFFDWFRVFMRMILLFSVLFYFKYYE